MTSISRGLAAALCLSLVAGCPTQTLLPPPATPAAVMPPLAPLAAEPNHSQVAIDADEPSTVDTVSGTYDNGPTTDADGNVYEDAGTLYKTLCTATPCVTSLRFGSHGLRITSNLDPNHSATDTLNVGPQPIDYRVALGHNSSQSIGPGIGFILGGTLATMGGSFLAAFTQSGSGISDAGWAGIGLAGLGTLALVVGVRLVIGAAFGGTVQPGASIQWSPQPLASPAAAQ